MQETQVLFLGQEDSMEKEMATHSSILALKNPTDRGAWRATVHGVLRIGRDLATKPPLYIYIYIYTHTHIYIYIHKIYNSNTINFIYFHRYHRVFLSLVVNIIGTWKF